MDDETVYDDVFFPTDKPYCVKLSHVGYVGYVLARFSMSDFSYTDDSTSEEGRSEDERRCALRYEDREKFPTKFPAGEVDWKQRAYPSLAKWQGKLKEPPEIWRTICSMLPATPLSSLMETCKGLVAFCARAIINSEEGQVFKYAATKFAAHQGSMVLVGWMVPTSSDKERLHRYHQILRYHKIFVCDGVTYTGLRVIGCTIASGLLKDGTYHFSVARDQVGMRLHRRHYDPTVSPSVDGRQRLWICVFNVPQLKCMVLAKQILVVALRDPDTAKKAIGAMLIDSLDGSLRQNKGHPSTRPSANTCAIEEQTLKCFNERVQEWVFDQTPYVGVQTVHNFIQSLQTLPWEAFTLSTLNKMKAIVAAKTHKRQATKWKGAQAIARARMIWAAKAEKEEERKVKEALPRF